MAEVAAIAAVVGSLIVYDASRDASKARERQQEIRSNEGRVQEIQARRQASREERIRRAQIAQASESLGVSASSTEAGAISSLSTQTASAMADQSRKINTIESLSALSGDIAKAQEQSALGSLVSSAGQAGVSLYGGWGSIGQNMSKGSK